MPFDFFPLIITTGMITSSTSDSLSEIIERAIEWSDFLVEHKFAGSFQKYVSCIKLIQNNRLEKQLLAKNDGDVYLIASERITDNIESLSLPKERIEELYRQGYIIAKVYGG